MRGNALHAHLLASKVPGSPEATLTVPLIYTNVGMPTWHGVHMIFTTSENHEFATPRQPCCLASRHPLGSLGAQPLGSLGAHRGIPSAAMLPCTRHSLGSHAAPLGIPSAAMLPCTRHPLGSHAALHSASPRQPCCAPRQPNCAPRQPLGSVLRAPRHPLGNHALHLGIPALHLGNPSRPLGIHTLASLKRLPQAHSPPYIYKCWHAHLARSSHDFHNK